jgi:two-component system CheB/CheR fusion protein
VNGGAENLLHTDWQESGVDMAKAGKSAPGGGYGRELIEHALPYQLNARTRFTLGPDGVRCTITVPVPADKPAQPVTSP